MIMYIGISNLPGEIDQASISRFSMCIPFFYPQPREYSVLLNHMIVNKFGMTLDDDVDLDHCGDILFEKRISPRKLVDIAADIKQKHNTDNNGCPVISQDEIQKTITFTINNHNNRQIEKYTLQSIRMTSCYSYFPWVNNAGILNSEYKFQPFLKRFISPVTGEPDIDSIDDRLEEIK